jgi:hypothetical protein
MADKQLNEKQLQALLRLKRYEQPPPGYFDDLLTSIHKRQREEMLRRPAWRVSLERVKTFFESMRVDWRYAGTMAGILLTGVGIIQIATPKKQAVTVASNPIPMLQTVAHQTQVAPQPMLTLDGQGQKLLPPLQRVVVPARPGSQPAPQFVGGSLPASYEATQIRF